MSKYFYMLLWSFLVFCGCFLRLWRLDFQSLWLDEIFSLVFSIQADLTRTVGRIRTDVHPPLYYLALRTWLHVFEQSDRNIRLFSAAISCLSIPLFFLLARQLLSRRAALIALTFFCIAAFQIWFAQEARSYAFLQFVVIAQSLFFIGLLREQRRALSCLGYAVTTAGVVYTNYIAVLTPLSHMGLLAVLWIRGQRNSSVFISWTVAIVGSLVMFLPWLSTAFHQFSTVKKEFWLPEPSFVELMAVPGKLLAYSLPISTLKQTPLAVLGIVSILLALILARFAEAKIRENMEFPTLLFLLSCFLGPIIGLFLISLLTGANIFYFKPLIISAPALYLLLAWGVSTIPMYALRAALLSALLFFCMHNLSWYYSITHKPDWRGAVRFLKNTTNRTHQFIFDSPAGRLPFDRAWGKKKYTVTTYTEAHRARVWVIQAIGGNSAEEIKEKMAARNYIRLEVLPLIGINLHRFKRSDVIPRDLAQEHG